MQWNALTLLLLRHKLEEEETDAAPGASNQRLPFAEQRGYLGSYDYINPYAQVSQLPEAATGGFAGPENQLNELPQKRKFLAIVNPFSGKQKGRALWNKAKSVLKHAHLEIEERITTSRDDAFMIAQKLIPNEVVRHDTLVRRYFDSWRRWYHTRNGKRLIDAARLASCVAYPACLLTRGHFRWSGGKHNACVWTRA